jgi:hypothetical protein
MRKALTITLVAALALFAGSAAYANYCARDVVPASTLLVPYAVQDMNGQYTADGNGYTTILTVTNVSRDAQVIHITVWNAESEACLDFNEVLSGYDVWQIFFRDMLNGNFGAFDTSRSATAAPNTGNRSPFEWGPDGRTAYTGATALTTPDTTGVTPGTDCFMPYGNGLNLNSNIDCLRGPLFSRAHAGCGNLKVRADYNNDWLANISSNPDTTDPIWYYVTVDVVYQCNFNFPSSDYYFRDNYKVANVLIGDIVYLAQAQNFSEAISAVHLESDVPNTMGDSWNFYQDVESLANSPVEPLATALAFNYYDMPNLGISSNVLLWKNYADFLTSSPYKVDDCGYYMYYNWDMDEHTNSRAGSCRVSPCNPNDIDPNEFPFETQSVPLTKQNFDLVASSGWMLIVFPPSYPTGYSDPTVDRYDPSGMMAWAGVKIVYGSYSAALEAATLANAHCFTGQILPQLGVNFDYDPPTE